ncbi:MAG: aminotransferase class I/II-fold pyridoxal phosphate-dependent enzyme [Candidatus Omnitrophota bacterium]
MLDQLLCQKQKTLLDALQAINENAKGAVFVVDHQKKLCGILTDGDVRRLLLAGHQLQESIEGVIKQKPVFARLNESQTEILNKLNKIVRILPVVDERDVVVDFVEYKGDIHFPLISPNLKGNELKYLLEAFLSTWISSRGEYILRFEKQFSQFCECPYGVATSSGTTALHLALLACGVGKGDEVIVPDLTFAATANAVLYTGAKPVIVDIEPESWCIDPQEIRKALTRKTRCVIPVHLYGQPCDMKEIMTIARKHHLAVIEDCAEAHGAEFDGRKVGSFGDVACFSFFGNKIITTGEGGMCVTKSKRLERKMRLLRDHGMNPGKRYWHDCVGYNYRMTNLQAAIGVAQLERIEEILESRERVERIYREGLSGIPFIDFQRNDLPRRKKIVWLVSCLLQTGRKNQYFKQFQQRGIDVRPFFYPLSSMDIYKDYVFSNKNSREISRKGVSLPTSLDNYETVISILREVLLGSGR